ncbi:MAG: serine hydrolase domain-containing protein [Gemmatimonadaceae bacterium]
MHHASRHSALTAALLFFGLLAPAAGMQAQSALPDSIRVRIDSVFSRWDRTDAPGCALGVSQGGKSVYERGYGMSDLQHGLAITPRSIFHVASISKQFAAFSVALLARDGKLSLDDDVRKYVSEIPDYGKRITLRQLIHHTSGLRDQWQLLAYAGWRYPDDLITERDVLDIVSRQRGLNFSPGDEYIYSNTGYTLLAVIVKQVSGQSLREFAQARLFEPLGMRDTHFHDDHTMIVPGRTSAYEPRAGGGWRISIPVFDTYGATSLFTTAGDLLKWMANLDAPSTLGAQLVTEAETSAILTDGSPTGYGYGLSIDTYRGLRAIGHGGADAGYRAQVERYPERGLAIAVLCNSSTSGPNVLARRTADVLIGNSAPAAVARIDTVPRAVGRAVMERWVGMYRDPVSQSVIRLRLRGDSLSVSDGRRLITTSDSTVRVVGSGSGFVLRGSGDAPPVLVQLPRSTRDLVFRREVPMVATKALLAQYGGIYYSEELDTRYTLVPGDSTIALTHRKHDSAVLEPAFADAFTLPFGATALFTRDGRGRVTGFILSDGRLRGVRFVRER